MLSKKNIFRNLFILLAMFFFHSCTNDISLVENTETLDQEEVKVNIDEVQQNTIEEKVNRSNSLNTKDLGLKKFDYCKDFNGYYLADINCLPGTTWEVLYDFGSPIHNIHEHSNEYYIILKNGYIYKYDKKLNIPNLVFDFSKKVKMEDETGGLFSIAFHPDENFLIISYARTVDSVYNLYVEKIFIDKNNEILNSEILIKIKDEDNNKNHFGGNLIWSDFYNGFLLGIGDFDEPDYDSRFNSDSLNTSKYFGKILLLESNFEMNIQINNQDGNKEIIRNIVAFGLRNSWQFFEYNNYLFVSDVGLSKNEELTIFKLSENMANLGWPVYEGVDLSSDLDNIENYSLDIFSWEDGSKEDIVKKTIKESILPIFTYDHAPSDGVYRAAIIGGDIFKKVESKYFQKVVVSDYVSSELFLYNINDNFVTILPIENFFDNITSLRVLNYEKDSLIVSTISGKLYILKLPS